MEPNDLTVYEYIKKLEAEAVKLLMSYTGQYYPTALERTKFPTITTLWDNVPDRPGVNPEVIQARCPCGGLGFRGTNKTQIECATCGLILVPSL